VAVKPKKECVRRTWWLEARGLRKGKAKTRKRGWKAGEEDEILRF
jgi:hypothetical protein